MVFETSWDDGSVADMELARLLKKFKLPAVFYVHIDRELAWDKIREIAKDFEIGCHTVTHPADIKTLSDDELDYEIDKAKGMMESIFAKPITKFCYPRGRFDDRVVAKVKEAGFTEARTTEVLRLEYTDPFRKPTTVHVYPRKEYEGVSWIRVAYKLFDKAFEENKYFHLWGHGWEVNKLNEWKQLEDFLRYAAFKLQGKKELRGK